MAVIQQVYFAKEGYSIYIRAIKPDEDNPETGLIWIEGIHLVQEAIRSNCKFHSFYLKDKACENLELETLFKELINLP